jgi:hypothetical protein
MHRHKPGAHVWHALTTSKEAIAGYTAGTADPAASKEAVAIVRRRSRISLKAEITMWSIQLSMVWAIAKLACDTWTS